MSESIYQFVEGDHTRIVTDHISASIHNMNFRQNYFNEVYFHRQSSSYINNAYLIFIWFYIKSSLRKNKNIEDQSILFWPETDTFQSLIWNISIYISLVKWSINAVFLFVEWQHETQMKNQKRKFPSATCDSINFGKCKKKKKIFLGQIVLLCPIQ